MSAPRSEFVRYLEEVFASFGVVEARRMFGGYGLFREGLMFGLVAADELYLKADAASAAAFVERGLGQFEYQKQGKVVRLSYYRAPEEIFDDPDEAGAWAASAYEAALRSRKPLSHGAPGMQRLFVALPLPVAIARGLARLRPRPAAGIRLAAESDLHVTLHFLGSAEAAAVGKALAVATAGGFEVRLGRPGHFGPAGSRRILFVGVELSPSLESLHRSVADALLAVGFEPERRPYRPHVTLARLAGGVSQSVVERFERQRLPAAAQTFSCDRFALFASQADAAGARYRVIETYGLREAG